VRVIHYHLSHGGANRSRGNLCQSRFDKHARP
jgi:hypothetical protein